MCKPGHMCTPLSSHVFHISALLSDTATTSQVVIKPAPPLLSRRTAVLPLPMHPRGVLEDYIFCIASMPYSTTNTHFRSAVRVFPVPARGSRRWKTERTYTSQAQYLGPLCTSPLSLDLRIPVDIPVPSMVCGDAHKLLKRKWTMTEIVQNVHCETWKWPHFGTILIWLIYFHFSFLLSTRKPGQVQCIVPGHCYYEHSLLTLA